MTNTAQKQALKVFCYKFISALGLVPISSFLRIHQTIRLLTGRFLPPGRTTGWPLTWGQSTPSLESGLLDGACKDHGDMP